MRAIRIESFGGPEVLKLTEVPIPEPGAGELLVKVEAAGVNPVDYKIRQGKYPAVKADKLPYTLGRDVAGVVQKRGAGANQFAEGDAIFAMPGIDRGGYSQYVLVRQSEAAAKPKSLDRIEAGSVPLAALTAWQGLFRHGGLAAGQRVLIHGGSGGVGHFAIQFARVKGAHVCTTVSGQHADLARQWGADEVIDYKKQRFEDELDEVDMVFDLVGGETQDRSWSVLRRGGILVSTLMQPPAEKAAARGARGTRYTVEESGAELAQIAALIEAGKVKPHISRTFRLEEAAAAQEFLETGHPAGKVVLRVA